MNDPSRFRIYRTVTGSESKEKKFLPMRKGIADITVRTQVSSARINSFTEQVASLGGEACVGDLISKFSKPVISNGKRYRGLEVTGKDLVLLQAIADPKYHVDAITNKHLQEALGGSSWANRMEGRRLSGRISRQLRLLREHGLIKKLPKQHKYMLTDKGRQLTTALNQFLHCIRRTVASRMYSNNIPLEEIRRWLGHTSLDTTLKYIYNPFREYTTQEIIRQSSILATNQNYRHLSSKKFDEIKIKNSRKAI